MSASEISSANAGPSVGEGPLGVSVPGSTAGGWLEELAPAEPAGSSCWRYGGREPEPVEHFSLRLTSGCFPDDGSSGGGTDGCCSAVPGPCETALSVLLPPLYLEQKGAWPRCLLNWMLCALL